MRNWLLNNIFALLLMFLVNTANSVMWALLIKLNVYGGENIINIIFMFIPIVVCWIISCKIAGVVLKDFGTVKNNVKYTVLVLIFILTLCVISIFGRPDCIFDFAFVVTFYYSAFRITADLSNVMPVGENYVFVHFLNLICVIIEYIFILKGMGKSRKAIDSDKKE